MATAGLSTPNDIIYLDTYFSDISGNRLVNLGSVSGGYTDITTHERQDPEIYTTGNISSPPSGYTVIFGALAVTSGNCLDDDPLPGGTIGTTGISFYFGFLGIYGVETRAVEATSVTIRIAYDGETKTSSWERYRIRQKRPSQIPYQDLKPGRMIRTRI
jgi:hypothetical protein